MTRCFHRDVETWEELQCFKCGRRWHGSEYSPDGCAHVVAVVLQTKCKRCGFQFPENWRGDQP